MALIEKILASLQDTRILLAVLSVLAVFIFMFTMNYDAPASDIPLIGYEPSFTYWKSKFKFIRDGKKILLEGMKVYYAYQYTARIYGNLGRPFQVIMPTGPEIIFPSSYVDEFKNDKRLSFSAWIANALFTSYPGFEGVRAIAINNVIHESVRVKLTQSLGLITQDICDETDFAASKIFGESREWKEISLSETIPHFIARISTRVFLGPVLARDETWPKISVYYALEMAGSARALYICPAILRSVFQWVLPWCRTLRKRFAQASEVLKKETERRQVKWDADAAEGKKASKMADSLGWMREIAKEQGVKDFDIVGAQLGLTFVAIHTTGDLLSKCLIRLSKTPEYQTLLRSEILEVLKKEGAIKKTTLYHMRLLDSFMKEVQRLEPAALTLFNRVATEEITLKDGTVLHKGASMKVFGDGSFDPQKFASPETFDPQRFLNLRGQPGQENNWQFVTTTPDHLGFGHGIHACPGRFFAAMELKIMLCWLLLKYDWKVIEDKEPAVLYLGGEIMVDQAAKLMLRRRQEEIDLSAFL